MMGSWFYFGLLSMMGYGVGPILAKKLTERLTPLQGVFLTNLAVVAICWGAAAFEGPMRTPEPFAWVILLIGGMTGAIAILSLFKGIESGQVSIIAPIANAFPIVTWGLSLTFLRLPFSVASFVCTLLVITGVIVLIYQKKIGTTWNRSALFGVITAIGWGAHAFFIFILMDTGLPPFTTGFYLEGAILLWLVVFLSVRQSFKNLDVRQMWPYGLFCGIATALGALMYTFSVSNGGNPEWVATIVGSNPMLTTLIAVILLKEKLALKQVVGISIIIAGLLAMRFIPML